MHPEMDRSDELDESFELLSSMSPKIDKMKKRRPRRGHTILALKRNFRRSSVYDNAKSTIKNESLVLVEPSSTDSSPLESPTKNEKLSSAIIISDTDIDTSNNITISSDSCTKSADECQEPVHYKEPHRQLGNKLADISEKKKCAIESWIDSVTVTLNNETNFSELSSIVGTNYKSEGSRHATNSTFVDSASRRFDELFPNKQLDLKMVVNETYKKCVEDSSFEDSFHLHLSMEDKSSTNEACDNENKVLDKNKLVEIDDSFSNLSIDDSLDENTDIKKNPGSKEGAVRNTSTEYIYNEVNIEVNKKSDVVYKLETSKNLLDERRKENLERVNKSNSETHEISFKKDIIEDSVCSDNEIHSMLDEIYGNSWRENKKYVLPQSEKKAKSNMRDDIFQKISKTEQKPATFVRKEGTKSNNLLESLQRVRMKAAVESPWTMKLKSLCDSDSSIEEHDDNKLIPIKLDFNSDGKTHPVNKKECEPWEESADSSDEQKLTDTSDWGQSLEDRVKKKIQNKNPPPLQKQVNAANEKKTVSKEPPPQRKLTEKKPKKTRKKIPDQVSDSTDDEAVTYNRLECDKKGDGTYSFLASLSSNVPITKCDMSARIFRNCFKKLKNDLAQKLFTMFNEQVFDNALPKETEIKWNDRLIGTAGRCDCVKVTRRTGVIERSAKLMLSSKILDKPDRLRDTMIHEMCHAATWIVNQVADGHGHFWRTWAHKAMSKFPELPPIKRCHDYVINTKYTYRCTGCSYSIGRHSKSLDIERKRCGHCYGKFEILLNKTSKKGEQKAVPVTPKKQPTGFALFVKDNYAIHKSHQLKHADVMRILGQKFAELKTD